MQIIIPMAGVGRRFKDAGYKEKKYLLMIQGKTIIEKIISNFDSQNDTFLFICNDDDFKKQNLDTLLKSLKIKYNISSVPSHKLGPVYTIFGAQKYIDNTSEIVVNYCDFFWEWNYEEFKEKVKKYDGAIVCYKGFHPHLLRKNLYAGVRTNEFSELEEIKEKFSFTEDKMLTWQSSGTYYFKSGEMLKKYVTEGLEKEIISNNEYYVSSLYNLIKRDEGKVLIYEIPYFLQLGTPADYEEYKYREEIFNPTNAQHPVKP